MAGKRAGAEKRGRPVPERADEIAFLSDDRANPTIAWPMRLFDCSPISDGAAALLLVSEDLAASFSETPLYVIGSDQASDSALHDRKSLTSIGAAGRAGRSWKAAEDGRTARSGPRPINTSGGLKSKGHPVGASGAGQLVEIWKQLRGEAGGRQVPEARVGLTHNVGGTGQTCVDHIFERRG